MLTTSLCIFYQPRQSWRVFGLGGSARGGESLSSFRHIYQALRMKQNGGKIFTGEKEKGRRRLTDRETQADRQRQRSAWIAGRPCQSQGAEGTRGLLGSDRGWFILLIRSIILFSLCSLWVVTRRVASTCMPVWDQFSFKLHSQESVIVHKNTNRLISTVDKMQQ